MSDVELTAKALSWDLENDPTPVDAQWMGELAGWEYRAVPMMEAERWFTKHIQVVQNKGGWFLDVIPFGLRPFSKNPTRGQVRTLLRLMTMGDIGGPWVVERLECPE